MGALGADPAAPLRAPGAGPASRRHCAGGVRPVRGGRTQRPVGHRRPARPARRRQAGGAVRPARRPFPVRGRPPVGLRRGHPGHAGCPARRGQDPRLPLVPVLRQRQCVLLRAAGLVGRRPRHPDHPQSAGSPARQGKDRKVEPYLPRPVPGRDRGRQHRRRKHVLVACRPEPAVHRVAASALPPGAALRDRPTPGAALSPQRRGAAAASRPRPAPAGVPVARAAHRLDGRDRGPARQPLRGRRQPDRPQGRPAVAG